MCSVVTIDVGVVAHYFQQQRIEFYCCNNDWFVFVKRPCRKIDVGEMTETKL